MSSSDCPEVRRCITVTTRAPAVGEVDAVDYFFRTPEEFQHLERQGELLESARVHGHYYGTPRWWVEDQIAQGTDILLVIDVQGARSVRAQLERVVSIFPCAAIAARAGAPPADASQRPGGRNQDAPGQCGHRAPRRFRIRLPGDQRRPRVRRRRDCCNHHRGDPAHPPGPAAQEMVKSLLRGDDAPRRMMHRSVWPRLTAP